MIRKIGQNKVQGRIYTWPLMKCVGLCPQGN